MHRTDHTGNADESADNAANTGPGNAVRSIATAGIHLQCLALYCSTGLLKGGDDWRQGWAVHSSLLLNTFQRDNAVANFLRRTIDLGEF